MPIAKNELFFSSKYAVLYCPCNSKPNHNPS